MLLPTTLLHLWEANERESVAEYLCTDCHPNILIDFSNLLFMKYGPPAIIELKAEINDYKCNLV